jgi:hypothetical protein
MPLYTFENKETGEVSELSMKIAERDQYVIDNPHMRQIITGAPAIGDPHRMGVVKTPDSFNSLLKHIKKGNSKGISDSTIKTR